MARMSTRLRRRMKRFSRRTENMVRTPAVAPPNFRLYRFDATFRLTGVGEHHDTITALTGLEPTHSHRKGESRSHRSTFRPWQEDAWMIDSPMGPNASLDQHLAWLWRAISPHKVYFSTLIAQASSADIVLGCLSESPSPVLTVEGQSLELLKALDLSIAFNFTCV